MYNYINGICRSNRSNRDDFGCAVEWPTRFVAVPRIGDLVESDGGKLLSVCSITHKDNNDKNTQPYIIVELIR